MFRKPFYKRFIKLRTNIQNKDKIFNFQREKWELLKKMSLKKKYRKFKIYDFSKRKIRFFGKKYWMYSKIFNTCLQTSHLLRIYYGKLSKKSFKKIAHEVVKKKKNGTVFYKKPWN